ncbi:TetR/AcrR family transcriptional regulator [Tepidimonas sp.]|uniref:TetR/AcrR family transcriptional regulator n=1 Tax=Tepidimonas sp. TaxID=2002775 RepID=UPI00391D0A49
MILQTDGTRGGTPGRPVDMRKDELILQAGRTLLLTGGPAALTMEAVARASGVSKATLYRRWPHRDALLEALVLREAQPLLGTLDAVPADAVALAEVLERFLDSMLAFVTQPAYQAYLQAIAALPQPQADLQRIWRLGPQQAIDAVATLLRRHAAAQGRRWPGAARDAETLIGMAMGLELARILYRQPPRQADVRLRQRHVRAVVGRFLDAMPRGGPAVDGGMGRA